MSYLVLARKYRPSSFAEVAGQEQVTRTLAHAIERGKVVHAHLFCGPRGVGKTSVARIFAKALNCHEGPTATPCQVCPSCREIAAGNSLGVREIDGASHNGVGNVRELIESFRSAPPPGSKYKVYIIDEVHMLSKEAFNALLKSLEEPPPYTVFILATTEAHKIPETVISRCQQHNFRALAREVVEKHLQEIAKQEQLQVEPEAIRIIARLCDGSMRDAQSQLDRIQSFCDDLITAEETARVLGAVDRLTLLEIARAIKEHDPGRVLAIIQEVFRIGADPVLFSREFVTFWREVMIAKFGGKIALNSIGTATDEMQDLFDLVEGISERDVQDLVQLARSGADNAIRSLYPRYAIEALVVQMAVRQPVQDLHNIVAGISKLLGPNKNPVSGGSGGQGVRAASSGSQSKSTNYVKQKRTAPGTVDHAPRKTKGRERQPLAVAAEPTWEGFVAAIDASESHVLAEQLRRLEARCFSVGRLELIGPEFSINYVNKEGSRLKGCLNEYYPAEHWSISCAVAEGVAMHDLNSLKQQQQVQILREDAKFKETVNNHPAVKNVLKFFPGSIVENV